MNTVSCVKYVLVWVSWSSIWWSFSIVLGCLGLLWSLVHWSSFWRRALYIWSSTNGNLLGSNSLLFKSSLQSSKEVLNRIQPWWVLCIEDHIHFEGFASVEDVLMFVHHCVIHVEYNVTVHISLITGHTHQHVVDKVLKDHCVNSTLHDLVGDHCILTDGWDQCELVVLSLYLLLPHLQLHSYHSKLAKLQLSFVYELSYSVNTAHYIVFSLVISVVTYLYLFYHCLGEHLQTCLQSAISIVHTQLWCPLPSLRGDSSELRWVQSHLALFWLWIRLVSHRTYAWKESYEEHFADEASWFGLLLEVFTERLVSSSWMCASSWQ